MTFDVPIRFGKIQLNALHFRRRLGTTQIINAVCKEFGVSWHRILTRDRTERVALARQVIMFICHEDLDMDHYEIGKLVWRNFKTCDHGIHAVDDRCSVDPKFFQCLVHLRASLR